MQRAKDITEVIKNVAQILAIVIAGVWTYYLFGQKEAPSLEARADINSSLIWENSNDDACRAVFKVVLQNTGNSSFDISKMHLQAWLFDKIHDTSGKITFLDIDEKQNSGEKIFDKIYETKQNGTGTLIPFINHYPPEAAYNHSFEWEVNDENKWICFKIEFFEKEDDKGPKWMTSVWDRVCNVQTKIPAE